jgi:hypothetical protein
MLNIDKRTEIIFHFNKMSLQDPNVPMWVIKAKGETHYVDHVDMESGVGFSTKETPDNPSTNGSIKFKAKLRIEKQDNRVVATIYP